ncbi:17561_t:CDS:2 [Rhizophagus irregularis]|nr:17561_t:CDS:2 [Rhizophagus irregularis]
MQDYAQQESDFQAGIPPRLISIFYSVFDLNKGPKVVFEVPEGSIISTGLSTSIIDFDSISEYIIPKQQLCGHLVSICTESYKIMGFPVYIEDDKYERNAFMFNLSFVFDRDADTSSYEPVVRKVARVLTSLETENEFLSNEATKDVMYNIIEQLLEDLNSYCECQIPINSANTINLKLFPTYRNPPPVYDYQVPICTVNLKALMDDNWDITMKKATMHINGIHHVKKIAEMADVDYGLARKCMEHLLYYGCVIMIDIFQFSNVYAVKPDIMRIIEDETVQSECLSYVKKPGTTPPSFAKLFSLYCSLKHGSTLKEWVQDNQVESLNIDIRRFISFGVIKGFLYRVHKYPILPEPHNQQSELPSRLRKLLNGKHHYDEICTMEGCSARKLDEILAAEPEVKFIWR